MDGPNKGDRPQADKPNRGGRTVLMWFPRDWKCSSRILIWKSLAPYTLRPIIIEGDLQGRPS